MLQNSYTFYVYYLIDPTTSMPFYVGKGSGNRMYKHENSVKNGKIPHNNLKLYHRIKHILDLRLSVVYKKVFDKLNEKESFLKEQNEIRIIGKSNLCNLTEGGQGISGLKRSDTHKKKMSRMRKGKNNPFFGFHHTSETKEKMRLTHLGKNNPFYGEHHTKKVKKKISKSLIGNSHAKGHKWSQEWKDYFSKVLKGKKKSKSMRIKLSNTLKKPIVQFTNDGKFIKRWKSALDASKELKLTSIGDCLRKKTHTSGGYKWTYV